MARGLEWARGLEGLVVVSSGLESSGMASSALLEWGTAGDQDMTWREGLVARDREGS